MIVFLAVLVSEKKLTGNSALIIFEVIITFSHHLYQSTRVYFITEDIQWFDIEYGIETRVQY